MATTHPVYDRTFERNTAENYERYFVNLIGRPLAQDLVQLAQLQPGERVVDVGCGTGIVTRLAAERVGASGSVSGVDLNGAMLDVARAAAPSSIRWYETSAEAIPLPDASFDVVLSQVAMQFFTDKPAALREMRRLLADGGRVYVTTPAPTPVFDVVARTFDRYVPAMSGFVRAVFSFNDPGEAERLFREAGFADVEARRTEQPLRLPAPQEFFSQYIRSTPMAGPFAQLDAKVRADIEQAVVAGWQGWSNDGRLAFAQPILVVTARSRSSR